MVQSEVLEFLEDKKDYMPDKWFSTKEIKEALKDKINPDKIHKALVKLWRFGIVEFKGKNILSYDKVWRLK